jgi:hypothetical protein
LVHDFIPPNACAASGISVVEFMLPSFPSLFFEGWPVAESGVDAEPFFGRLWLLQLLHHIACGGINSSIPRWSQGIYLNTHRSLPALALPLISLQKSACRQ